jgi:hypothetical protein
MQYNEEKICKRKWLPAKALGYLNIHGPSLHYSDDAREMLNLKGKDKVSF